MGILGISFLVSSPFAFFSSFRFSQILVVQNEPFSFLLLVHLAATKKEDPISSETPARSGRQSTALG